MTQEEVTITLPKDVVDFVDRMVSARRFANPSHGFELMAIDYMEYMKKKDRSAFDKLESFTLTGITRSAAMVRSSVGKMKQSKMGQEMGESMGKFRSSGLVQKIDQSVDKFAKDVRESKVVRKMDESVDKALDSQLVQDVKESSVMKTLGESAGKVKDAVKGEEDDEPEAEQSE